MAHSRLNVVRVSLYQRVRHSPHDAGITDQRVATPTDTATDAELGCGRVKGCYLNIDDFLSKHRVLDLQLSAACPPGRATTTAAAAPSVSAEEAIRTPQEGHDGLPGAGNQAHC